MEIDLTKVGKLPRVYFEGGNYFIVIKMGTLLKKYAKEDSSRYYYIIDDVDVRDNSIVEVIYDQKFILDYNYKNTSDQTKFAGIYFTDSKLLKYFRN